MSDIARFDGSPWQLGYRQGREDAEAENKRVVEYAVHSRAVLDGIKRWTLVIESAVRNADPTNYEGVMAALTALQSFAAEHGPVEAVFPNPLTERRHCFNCKGRGCQHCGGTGYEWNGVGSSSENELCATCNWERVHHSTDKLACIVEDSNGCFVCYHATDTYRAARNQSGVTKEAKR